MPVRPDPSDLGPDLRRTFDQIFCRGRTADGPCQRLDRTVKAYRKRYLRPMRAFFASQRQGPDQTQVLYPFSGGDLLNALIAFPDARRFVLLSLERGGSPAPLKRVTPRRQKRARYRYVRHARRLLRLSYSHTVDLQEPEGKRLPGLLPFILLGLHVHGGVPTSLRTFRIEPEGTLRYFTRAELRDYRSRPAGKRRRHQWADPRYNEPFSHLELRFRLPGDRTDRVLQHVAVDISNPGLERVPSLEPYLVRLGHHAVLIKAASYLLWKKRYADIRNLVFRQARQLVGDMSSPQPDWLRRQGFQLRLFGWFDCPVLRDYRRLARKWRRAYRRGRPRPAPARFGYGDCRRNPSVVIAVRGKRAV